MVLVNCPVYFSLFLVDQKKICSVSGNIWSVSEFFLVRLWFFGILKRNFGVPKRNLVDQKNQSLTKNSLRLNKFFFGQPKKGRNRLDNWSTKRLTKTTWTGLLSTGRQQVTGGTRWDLTMKIIVNQSNKTAGLLFQVCMWVCQIASPALGVIFARNVKLVYHLMR